MLVESNIYIYIYHPRDVCAIENAVAILPLIYKKWSQENLKGENGNQSLVPNCFSIDLFLKKASKLKKKIHSSDEIHIEKQPLSSEKFTRASLLSCKLGKKRKA